MSLYLPVKRLLAVLLFVLCSFMFVSCKSDDKVDTTGTGKSAPAATASGNKLHEVTVTAPGITSVYEEGADQYDEEYYEGDYYEGDEGDYGCDPEYEDCEESGDYGDHPGAGTSVATVVDSHAKTVLGRPDAVAFYFEYSDDTGSPSAIDIYNEEFPKEYVNITPDVKGTWRWYDDYTVTFRPDEDWPADQEYKVTFNPKLFNPEYKLKNYTYKFRTQPFAGAISSFRLYQTPISENGAISEPFAVATIYFTYPVNPQSLEKGVTLTYNNKAIKAAVTYDDVRRYAFVKSEDIRLGEKAGLLQLSINSASTTSGGAAMAEKQSRAIDVPSMSEFFKVNGANISIINNANGEPEQFLTLDFTLPVAVDGLADSVRIYKLPRKYDNSTWYNWRDFNGQITQEFLSKFPAVKLEYMKETGAENIQAAKFFVSPKESVQLGIMIPKGLKSKNDYTLSAAYFRVLDVPRFPMELKFTQDGNILTLSGDKSLTLMSRGVDKVKVEVARIMPARLNHLISQTYGEMKQANFENYNFNEYDISTFFTTEVTLNNSNPARLNYFSVDLAPYLTGTNTAGIFIVKVYPWDGSSYSYSPRDRRLIQVTDMGIVMKENIDKSRDVYVMSMRTAQPFGGADVYYLTRNGKSLNKTTTNSSGNAKMPEVKYNSNRPEENAVALVIESGNDYSFMPLNRGNYMVNYNRFDVGGEYSSSRSNPNVMGLKSYLFTERGIYRPGDPVHIGMIAKQEDWSSLAGVPMELTITNPRGQQVMKHRFTMNEAGFAEAEYQTDYTSLTGVYSMSFTVVRDDSGSTKWDYRQLGASSFKVEEFKPDTMKISARIAGPAVKGWLPLAGLSADVTLNNLFGRPAQNRTIRWQYQLAPASFYFKEYREYTFTDPYRDLNSYRYINPVTLPEARTDNNGNVTAKIDLSKYSGGLYSLMLYAEGFEDGSGDSVVTTASRLVSPMEHLVGYKTNGNISYLKKDAAQKVSFIAIDSNLDRIDMAGLQYTVVEKRHVSLLVRQRDGTYAFQSVARDVIGSAGKLNIEAKGTDFTLPTDTPGTFQLLVKNNDGLLLSRVDYFVAGTSNLTLSLDKNAELNLTLDKKEYATGEEIEINIIAPYTGTGLITIERDKVYAHKWFRTSTTSSRQTIRVPAELEGNGYVNVSFLRSPDSKEVFITPHSYAVAPFSVNRAAHATDVKISVPEEARPGQPLKIEYSANKSGKIVVFAVDEGILQVAGYTPPQPLNDFFRKRALQVNTYQVLDMLLSDSKAVMQAAGIGGGMADEAMAALKANLNPFKRKTELPIVYWSGVMDVTAGRTSNIIYNVPSYFNGTLRVMAVAVSSDSVGSTSQQMLIRAPIIVQPNMPVNFAPGDKAGVSVTISNNMTGSGTNSLINVEIAADEYFEITGENSKELRLSEGNEGRADFEIQATGKLGSGTVTITASSPAMVDSEIIITATASVRPATAYDTVITTGVSSRNDVSITKFSRDMYPELASRSVTASHNPLLIARGLTQYLEKYPHGCTEQITSQSFPTLYIKNTPLMTEKEAQESFRRTLTILRARQLDNGGFMLWPGGWSNAHSFSSVYAMHYLADAKAHGYHVPADMIDKGNRWLSSYISKPVDSLYDARIKTYAAYVLTRNGVVTTAFLTNLEEALNKNYAKEWKGDVVASYMAAIYKMLQMDEKARDLIRGYIPDVKQRFIFYSDFDTSSLRNTTYMYLLATHFPDMITSVDTKLIMNLLDSIADQHYNSLLSSYSILALYALAESTTGQDEGMKILMDTSNAKGINLETAATPYPTAAYKEIAAKLTGETAKAGTLGFFIVATEQGFDRAMPEKTANGIEIQREYLDSDGKVKTAFSQGDDVTVRIRVRTNGNMNYIENVAIVDLLPGSFEVQSDSVAALQRSAYGGSYSDRFFDYVDVREDRLVFYVPLTGSVKELTYKAKVVSRGEFAIPPAYASAMYDPVYRGNTAGGKLTVTENTK